MQTDPLDIDHSFFAALKAADLPAIDRLLADDFILVDVMSGAENMKAAFLGMVASRLVKFDAIEPSENRVLLYGATAIVTGRTEMKGRVGDAPFAASSRYTHVYVLSGQEWRMVTAQGTPIK